MDAEPAEKRRKIETSSSSTTTITTTVTTKKRCSCHGKSMTLCVYSLSNQHQCECRESGPRNWCTNECNCNSQWCKMRATTYLEPAKDPKKTDLPFRETKIVVGEGKNEVIKREYFRGEEEDWPIECGSRLFGATQYFGLFSPKELEQIEQLVTKMKTEKWKTNTLNRLERKNGELQRTKYFFPKYSYGEGGVPKIGDCNPVPAKDGKCNRCLGVQHVTTEDCDDIPSWLQEQVVKKLVLDGILEDNFVNEVVINHYHTPSSMLDSHFDSPHLFERPIVSLRVLGDAVHGLQFNVYRGGGAAMRTLPILRGVVTILEGFAANKVNHRVPNVGNPCATILMRNIHKELLPSSWIARNQIDWSKQKEEKEENGVGPAF